MRVGLGMGLSSRLNYLVELQVAQGKEMGMSSRNMTMSGMTSSVTWLCMQGIFADQQAGT